MRPLLGMPVALVKSQSAPPQPNGLPPTGSGVAVWIAGSVARVEVVAAKLPSSCYMGAGSVTVSGSFVWVFVREGVRIF